MRRLGAVAIGLGLAALATLHGLHRIRAYDYWWHLRTGAWIVEHGRVPTQDPFSYTAFGSPWLDVHWLFQVVLHGLQGLAGHAGVVAMKAVLALAVLGFAAATGGRGSRPVVSALPLALLLSIASERLLARPEGVSFALLAAVFFLLERHGRTGDRLVYALIPLHWIWANLHGLYAVGLALSAMALLPELMRPVLRRDEGFRRTPALRLAGALAGAGLACAVTPGGLDTLAYPLEQLGMIGPADARSLGASILELQPTLGAGGAAQPVLVLLAAGLAALATAALVANARHLNPAHPMMLIAFGFLGLTAIRNLSLFALVAAPIAVTNANAWLDRRPPWPRAAAVARILCVAALVWLLVDVASGRFAGRLGVDHQLGLGLTDGAFPAEAVDWIERERPEGPLAHHLADGGYLIARLWPRVPVLIDGRLEVYGAARYAELVFSEPEHFRRLDDRYGFGALLVHHTLGRFDDLLWWLQRSASWRLVHVDAVAAVYVREQGGATRWPRVDLDRADLFPPHDLPPGFADRAERRGRAGWYTAVRQYARALAEWEELLARYPDVHNGAAVHAMLRSRAAGALR